MSTETIICPHCDQPMEVPLDAEKVACPSCGGHVELLPDSLDQQDVPVEEEELYYEEDDPYPEKNIAMLITGYGALAIGTGLLFAPHVSSPIRGSVFAVGLVLGIIAIIQRRNIFGFVLLGITLLASSIIFGKVAIETAGRAADPQSDSDLPMAFAPVLDTPVPGGEQDAVSREIAALKRKKLAALSSEVLDRVRPSSPRLQWRRTGTATEPVLNFQLLNYTRHTLTEVVLNARVTSSDQAEPWLETQFHYVIPDKLAPRENKGVLTSPKEFNPLANAKVSGRIDLTLQLKVVNAMGPAGEYLIDPFTEADANRLAELEAR